MHTDTITDEFRTLKATFSTQNIREIIDTASEKKLEHYFEFLLNEERINLADIHMYKKEYFINDTQLILNNKDAASVLKSYFMDYINENEPKSKECNPLGVVYLAGVEHVPDISGLFLTLHVNDTLVLEKEERNPYDKNAIRVSTQYSKKLGYIPKRLNFFPSYMLEHNMNLIARIVKLRWSEKGYSIKIMVSLDV